MHKTLAITILFLSIFCVTGHAENEEYGTPVITAAPGKTVIGQTLSPGTYRVIPKLGPQQREASINITLADALPGKAPISDLPKTGNLAGPLKADSPQAEQTVSGIKTNAEPDTIDTPQSTPQKQAQDTKPDEPAGTGPEYECEYGLPTRNGTNCEIQLTSGDLPAGFRLDDFANFNKACEVHQWIMYGPDRNNRIEVNISTWGPRAESYYKWKHGMLSTGQYSQMDLPIGNKQLYVEAKNDCNKQLVMQVGMYLVEMDRPPVEGITQETDPIKREAFIAVAKAVENRIAAVAGIPPRDVMNGNPTTISWRSVSWNVRLQNDALLQVQGAGTGKWGSEWRAVGSGTPAIVSWNGIGTGQGPVIVYQRSNNVWTVVLVDYASGALKNIKQFNQRVTPMSGGEYGATIRSGDKCYDYSWEHLTEISCKSKNFIFGGTQSSISSTKNKDEPITTGTDLEFPGTGSEQPGFLKPGKKLTDPDDKKQQIQIPVKTSEDTYHRSNNITYYVNNQQYEPDWEFEYDDSVEIKILQEFNVEDPKNPDDPYREVKHPKKVWVDPVFETNGFGEFTGGKYHATKEGDGTIYLSPATEFYQIERNGTISKVKSEWENFDWPYQIHVNPPMVPADSWPLDKDMPVVGIQVLSTSVNISHEDENPLRVSLQGLNTSSVEKNADENNWVVFYVRDFTGEGKICPPGIYTIYVYQRAEDVAFDLHTYTEYKIALPVKQGSYWKKNIYVTTTGQKFKRE